MAWIKRFWIPLAVGFLSVVLVAGAIALARSRPPVCHLVGCDSEIAVVFHEIGRPRGQSMRLCVDDACRRAVLRPGAEAMVRVPCAGEPGTSHVVASVISATDKVIARDELNVERHRVEPNGPECGPTCWQASLAFDVSTGQLSD